MATKTKLTPRQIEQRVTAATKRRNGNSRQHPHGDPTEWNDLLPMGQNPDAAENCPAPSPVNVQAEAAEWDKEEPPPEVRRKQNGAKSASSETLTYDDLISDDAISSGGETKLVDVNLIFAGGLNPRQHFDQAELDDLAASIKAHGLLQPIVVRPISVLSHPKQFATGKSFELVAGERRYRAVQQLRWPQIKATIRRLTDEQARTLAVVENLDRESLNPIEEARGIQAIIKATGDTQEAIGQRLHKARSQAWIANRLRLLELPHEIQDLVISRQMSQSHALELLPWREYPGIIKPLIKHAAEVFDDSDGAPSLREWQELVLYAVREHTQPLEDYYGYHKPTGQYLGRLKITPTDEEREKLELIEVDGEPRARNVKLAGQLFEKAATAAAAKGKKSGKSATASSGDKKPPTSAELKAKRADQDKQLDKRVKLFAVDWARYLIAKVLSGSAKQLTPEGRTAPTKVLLWLAAHGAAYDTHGSRGTVIGEAALRHGGKVGRANWYSEQTELTVWSVPPAKFETFTMDCVRSMFWDAADAVPTQIVPAKICARLLADLEIDLQAAWRAELCGPLSETYFSLRTKDQLFDLAKELDVYLNPAWPKSQIVKHFVSTQSTKHKLPKDLGKKVG